MRQRMFALNVPKWKSFDDGQSAGALNWFPEADSPFYSVPAIAPAAAQNPSAPASSQAGAASGSSASPPSAAGAGSYNQIQIAVNGLAELQQLGMTGAGITIGIISNGFSSQDANGGTDFATAKAEGLVDPNAVDAKDDNTSTSDEGLAMAEIIHEIAPNAHVVFYTGEPGTESALSTAITALSTPVNQGGYGCNIICNDLFNLSQPFYQPGDQVDQAIDNAVASGVSVFQLAGNAGPTSFYADTSSSAFNQSLNITYQGVTQAYAAYNFGNSAFELVNIPNTSGPGQGLSAASIGLDWEQPWQSIDGGPSPQYYLEYLLFNDNNGQVGNLAFWGGGDGSADAMESGTASAGAYFLTIVVTSAPGSHSGNGSIGNPGSPNTIPSNENLFKIIFDNNNDAVVTISSANGQADPKAGGGSGSVWGQSEDLNAITVGAVNYATAPVYTGSDATIANEPFSSAGPGKYFFNQNGALISGGGETLGKVNLSAPDGGATGVDDSEFWGR